jgi:hypothetical protein
MTGEYLIDRMKEHRLIYNSLTMIDIIACRCRRHPLHMNNNETNNGYINNLGEGKKSAVQIEDESQEFT